MAEEEDKKNQENKSTNAGSQQGGKSVHNQGRSSNIKRRRRLRIWIKPKKEGEVGIVRKLPEDKPVEERPAEAKPVEEECRDIPTVDKRGKEFWYLHDQRQYDRDVCIALSSFGSELIMKIKMRMKPGLFYGEMQKKLAKAKKEKKEWEKNHQSVPF